MKVIFWVLSKLLNIILDEKDKPTETKASYLVNTVERLLSEMPVNRKA